MRVGKKYLLVYLLILLVFWVKAIIFLDPDFGWRLRAGEMYTSFGVPKTDPFTYTMPSYHWVDHAWSLSVLISFLFNNFGSVFLSFIFSVIALLAMVVVFERVKKYIYVKTFYKNTNFLLLSLYLPPFSFSINFDNLGFSAQLCFFLTASLFFTFFGVRVQVFSWLMLAVFAWLIYEKRLWKRWIWLTPIFFLFWANIHGSFASGILAYLFVIVLRSIRLKKVNPREIFFFVLSLGATFVNPYGAGVWREVWSSVSDNSLRWTIVEWMPALTMFDLAMVYLIGLSVILIWKYRHKFKLEEIGLSFIFLAQALLTRRHLPLWAIVTSPLVVVGIYYLWEDAKKQKGGIIRFSNVYKYAWLLAVSIFLIQAVFSFKEALSISESVYYPVGAITYLKEKLPEKNIFSEYGWGGYLIWKLPGKRVFIDGRMPSWEFKNPPKGELASAFDTFNDITKGDENYRDVFNKFDIDTVLWSKPRENDKLEEIYEKMENYLTIFGWEKKDFDFIKSLEESDWKQVYSDNTSVIYQK